MVGTLRPEEEVTVGNENPGIIDKVLVDLGDRVEAGQLLVQLDTREAHWAAEQAQAGLAAARKAADRARAALAATQANVGRLRAILDNARINRKRFEDLFAEGAIAASQRDTAAMDADVALASLRTAEAQVESDREAVAAADAAVQQAEATLSMARKRQQDTAIRAPVTGQVQKRLVSSGEAVKEKTPLLVLVRTRTLKLDGEIPERFASSVRPGLPIRVTTETVPGRQFAGRIVRVAPMINPQTRSFGIEAAVPNEADVLKAGAFAKAEIVIGKDRAVPFLPEEAVVDLAGVTKVFVVAGGKAAEKAVRLGGRQDGMIEILEGPAPGDQVATSSLGQLTDGRAVAVASSDGQKPEGSSSRQ
jgi:multidrug efflux pump subunit AcrA (membrane-fusion protein)